MARLWLDLALGLGIGLALGLLGGGGSILTVPALVYLIGQSPQAAMTTSLAIVGANSLMGVTFHNAHGAVQWRVALIFGGAGMIVAYFAAGLSRYFSPSVLLVAFALLMFIVGAAMLTYIPPAENTRADASPNWPVVLITGAGVGLLTGFLGVGGGFLITPALVMLVRLPMSQAIGTSLLIIAANSLAGLLGHLKDGAPDTGLILTFGLAGLAGTWAGAQLAHYLPVHRLRQGFAVFVFLLAILVLADNLPKLLA